jgi:4-oxalocrotonate tautomerase
MPLIQISVRAGRPPEKLRRMIGAVTAAVSESLDAPAASIRVIVTEVPLTHWATGDVTLQEKEDRGA